MLITHNFTVPTNISKGLLCIDKDPGNIQKWSFDVLSTDMKIDKECQIGFCPEEKKGKLKI